MSSASPRCWAFADHDIPSSASLTLQIQAVLDREHEIARQCLAKGDKTKALTALRRRKYQESLIQKTDSQLETLGGLVSTSISIAALTLPFGGVC